MAETAGPLLSSRQRRWLDVLIPLATLASLGLGRLRTLWRVQRTALLLPVAATVLISVAASFLAGAMEWRMIARDHEHSQAAASVIRNASAPDDRIWVWGNEPELLVHADQLAPAAVWTLLDSLVATLGPRNRALLAKRDALQAKIDAWLGARRGAAWRARVHPRCRAAGRSGVRDADQRCRRGG